MNWLVVLGTLGAGLGLSGSAAFNLRLLQAVRVPLAASLVNFSGGAALLLLLWACGIDGHRPDHWPAAWMFIGGPLGAIYVTVNIIGAARFGIGVSTVAVTLGQVLGALLISSLGWFGQHAQRPSWQAWLSALLLLGAVGLLAQDRQNSLRRSVDK
ncbi:DMT family transporter [Deinococcus sp.]|uniref:DMT family transporter n=1 Tax=Deinococcus sp. TaxID=47478 RepID=UPI0025BCF8AF|nr:DMT family transporter [Deinococcus sp.]